MNVLLSLGIMLIFNGLKLMPRDVWSPEWWITILGIILISNAIDTMTKRTAAKK